MSIGMSWWSFLPGSILLGLLAAAAYCMRPRRQSPPVRDHRMTLDPDDYANMVCWDCDFEMDLPEEAPRGVVERLQWAKAIGVAPWQDGRSVGFLEALRGMSE